MTCRLWILGADDPEMERVEALLREAGETVLHAVVGDRRVHPGNAYGDPARGFAGGYFRKEKDR